METNRVIMSLDLPQFNELLEALEDNQEMVDLINKNSRTMPLQGTGIATDTGRLETGQALMGILLKPGKEESDMVHVVNGLLGFTEICYSLLSLTKQTRVLIETQYPKGEDDTNAFFQSFGALLRDAICRKGDS